MVISNRFSLSKTPGTREPWRHAPAIISLIAGAESCSRSPELRPLTPFAGDFIIFRYIHSAKYARNSRGCVAREPLSTLRIRVLLGCEREVCLGARVQRAAEGLQLETRRFSPVTDVKCVPRYPETRTNVRASVVYTAATTHSGGTGAGRIAILTLNM